MKVIIDGVRYVPDTKQTPELIAQFHWGERSLERMKNIHPDLRKVLDRVIEITPIDLTVLEGLRHIDRQRELVKNGSSSAMNSRHLTGHAVDIAPIDEDGDISWAWPLYHKVAKVMFEAAKEMDISIEWGGDWAMFPDGPHWELSWTEYPA